MTRHITGLAAIAVDCRNPAGLASFWQVLLGGSVEVDSDGDATLRGLPVRIDFLAVPEQKTTKNRLHLDLGSTDLDAAVTEAVDAGATRADDVYDGDGWVVLRDPEGNEFCILRAPAA